MILGSAEASMETSNSVGKSEWNVTAVGKSSKYLPEESPMSRELFPSK